MHDPTAPETGPIASNAAPQSGRRCPNCGSTAPGRFCAACGQEQGRRLASMRAMAADALADQFTLEAALPRTLRGLLRPGFLTTEYLAGRIVRYVPPLRLYLVSSLVFFLAVSLQGSSTIWESASTAGDGRAAGGVEATVEATRSPPAEDAAAPDRDAAPAEGWRGALQRRLDRQQRRLEDAPPGEVARRVREALTRFAPTAVFLLIPVFALLLKALYFRREHLYAEHFVFALHVHAFAFALFTARVMMPWEAIRILLMIGLLAYVWMALRRVYPQSRTRVALKFVLLGAGYLIAFTATMAATAMLAVLSV